MAEAECSTSLKDREPSKVTSSDQSNQRNMHDKLRNDMVTRLSLTDAHFKHQQIGEPELQPCDKAAIANEILVKSPTKFLERFSAHLTKPDLKYFEKMKGDYIIDFYLSEISKRLMDKQTVKNRRYKAMQKLMTEGEYFSHNEMKWRDPLLFEQMVGQYETEAEQDAREIDKSDLKFSSILLKSIDATSNQEKYEKLKESEECQEEEEEEDSSDEDEMDSESEESDGENIKKKDKDIKDKKNDTKQEDEEDEENSEGEKDESEDEASGGISAVEKGQLQGEFLKIMQERFMAGADDDFDYSAVDSNADYDALDILAHDAEERYFDDDDAVMEVDPKTSKSAEPDGTEEEDEDDYMLYEPSADVILSSREAATAATGEG